MVERALVSLASISFNEKSPGTPKFYEAKITERLLKIVDQLESRTSYYALDAIR
jgi:hypothetical protein